jgi:uncharacterized Zn-binding protein involved in type VI secretion
MTTGTVPHIGGPIIPAGSANVIIEYRPAARVGDRCICIGPIDSIATGSSTVLINNRPAARMGDRTEHSGIILTGSSTVIVGGPAVAARGEGFFGQVEDFFEGAWDEGRGMVTGIVSLAKELIHDPGAVLRNLEYAVEHPMQVWDALSKPYKDAIASGHPMQAIGRGVVAVGSFFLAGAGVVGKAGEGANVAAKIAETSEVLDTTAEAAEATQAINIADDGLQHVIERHTNAGPVKYLGKSKFADEVDVPELIQSAENVEPVVQRNGNLQRTFDAGRQIGVDRTTGQSTSVVTVITKPNGDLVTAFPGNP